MTLSELKKLHDMRAKGCVAYGKWNGKYYYAINKDFDDQKNKDIGNEIKAILEADSLINFATNEIEYIGVKFAYSYIDPDSNEPHYPKKYASLFSYLKRKDYAGIRIKCVPRIPYKKDEYNKELNRYWTCAEKKLFSFQHFMEYVYITKRPCYYCLPVISSCFYLTDDFSEIRRLTNIETIYDASKAYTYFKFTEKN